MYLLVIEQHKVVEQGSRTQHSLSSLSNVLGSTLAGWSRGFIHSLTHPDHPVVDAVPRVLVAVVDAVRVEHRGSCAVGNHNLAVAVVAHVGRKGQA